MLCGEHVEVVEGDVGVVREVIRVDSGNVGECQGVVGAVCDSELGGDRWDAGVSRLLVVGAGLSKAELLHGCV